MKDFRGLKVWHKAHALVLDVYEVTESFPPRERYELARQIRTSGSSIATNLAEGCGRGSDADFSRFVSISMGSASELEYQLLLAADLKLLGRTEYNRLHEMTVEVKRMLASLLRTLKADR